MKKQGGLCKLCNQPIDKDDVLDHCHTTGWVRAVIHRGCNCLLGKIENNIARNRISEEMLTAILLNYSKYVKDYTEVVHPTFKTPEEKKALAAKRRKRNARRRRDL